MMESPPRIADAPGLTWRKIKHGWQARWRARKDLIKRGYKPKAQHLWASTAEHPEPLPAAIDMIQDWCNINQSQMLVWGRGDLPKPSAFDGTLRSLVDCYQTDEDSQYKKVRYRTRLHYDVLCKRILDEHAAENVAEIKARLLTRWHEQWSEKGHVAMAHALAGMMRTLINFGATYLEDKECERLSAVLHRMKFKMAKPRNERLTAEQAQLVIDKAHDMDRHSIALAQALQFDLMLRQKDVIGEWVPLAEPGPLSVVINGNDKWIRGLRWEEIDANMILRHTTSKRQKDVTMDLTNAPMVMEEFARIGKRPASGPIIVNENTGLPWTVHQFRFAWREIATAAGIPKTIRNMDSRAGAISEATDAGADLEHVRHMATHSDIKMTQRYSRGAEEKVENVMQLRAAHRNKSGT